MRGRKKKRSKAQFLALGEPGRRFVVMTCKVSPSGFNTQRKSFFRLVFLFFEQTLSNKQSV